MKIFLRKFAASKTNFFKEAISLILIWRYLFDIKSDKWQKNNKLSLLSKTIHDALALLGVDTVEEM